MTRKIFDGFVSTFGIEIGPRKVCVFNNNKFGKYARLQGRPLRKLNELRIITRRVNQLLEYNIFP